MGNGLKLKEGRLEIRKKFFIMRVMRYWKRLSWGTVDASSLKYSNSGRMEL